MQVSSRAAYDLFFDGSGEVVVVIPVKMAGPFAFVQNSFSFDAYGLAQVARAEKRSWKCQSVSCKYLTNHNPFHFLHQRIVRSF